MTQIKEPIAPLGDNDIAEVADLLRVVGEPSRLRILLACLNGPGAVGDLALRAGVTASLASHHLRLLRTSRLLRAERRGKQVIYSLRDARVRCIVVDLAAHVLEGRERAEANG
jgi:ArsR family transcriptional regulator